MSARPPAAPPARSGRLVRAAAVVVPPLALLAIVCVLWHVIVTAFEVPPYLVPGPVAVAAAAAKQWPALLRATGLTGAAALCGFLASLGVGAAVAFIFSQSLLIRRSFYPYAIFLQTVPIVAIAPLIIIWFGYGFTSVVVVSFIIGIFPIITNTTAGLTTVDATLLELFEVYNASRWQVLTKLRLPNAVPYLVAGAKVSSGLSVIGAIVGEFYAGSSTTHHGLGYIITVASGQLKTAYLFAAVLASTALGFAIFAAIGLAGDAILARWHESR